MSNLREECKKCFELQRMDCSGQSKDKELTCYLYADGKSTESKVIEVKTTIREYGEDSIVSIIDSGNERLRIKALNEGGCNCTLVDLVDVIEWVKINKPELL